MIRVDEVMRDRQVLHRQNAADLSSRATVMRRLRDGRWWRPTEWTVALRQESYDADFDLLVASAHLEPDGGVGGETLLRVLGLKPAPGLVLPREIQASTLHGNTVPPVTDCVVRQRSTVDLRAVKLPSGRELSIDVGPGSLADAATLLATSDVSWLFIQLNQLTQAGGLKTDVPGQFLDYAARVRRSIEPSWLDIAKAVQSGCESAGEVYVWHILTSLGIKFRTQHPIAVDPDAPLNTRRIRTDFLLENGVIIEVDSALHDHRSDVRRDLWNLTEGRRTIRVVGTDVIADPMRAQQELATALSRLGLPVRPTSLPPWLTTAA